jgi:hypothetical protein
MGNKAKAKGSRYEREFVALCDEAGLPAERRYGNRECDDILVADEWRIECKYRSDGSGFKRLHEWLGAHTRLAVLGDGCRLEVHTLEAWAALKTLQLDSDNVEPNFSEVRESASSWATLRRWVGDADYLALRMRGMPWLVVRVA